MKLKEISDGIGIIKEKRKSAAFVATTRDKEVEL